MEKTLILFKGEMIRLFKYKIALVALVVSLMWVACLAFVGRQEAGMIASMLVYTDAGIMSALLVCSAMYFERQEGTLRTVLITPVSIDSIVVAKIMSSTALGLTSGLVVGLSVTLIHGFAVNWIMLLIGVVLSLIMTSSIAIVISIYSKTFSNMLINYMLFVLILIMPTMMIGLGAFGEVGTVTQYLMLISPLYCAQVLINSAFAPEDAIKLIIACMYCFAIFMLLYFGVIRRKFSAYAIGE